MTSGNVDEEFVPTEEQLIQMIEAAIHAELKLNSHKTPNYADIKSRWPLEFGSSSLIKDKKLFIYYLNPTFDINNDDDEFEYKFEISVRLCSSKDE